MTSESKSLSIGILVALTQFEVNNKKKADAESQLREKKTWQDNFKIIKELKNQINDHSNWYFNKSPKDNFERDCTILCGLLAENLPEDQALELFRCVNENYDCFEAFAMNFNDYLWMKQ